MKPVSLHADVWVIHDNNALLFRHQNGGWHQQMNMSFDAFVGSATALSSFTLGDTRVYLNLGKQKSVKEHSAFYHWTSIEHDPLRLVDIPEPAACQHQQKSLQSMGQTVTVISTDDPSSFARANPMARVNEVELKHLEQWVFGQKNGKGQLSAKLQLLASLWGKPGRTYQTLRAVALVCTIATVMLMQFHGHKQAGKNKYTTPQFSEQATKTTGPKAKPLQLEEWSTQISKFGKSDRANLTAMNIYWQHNGQINTTVQLNRERKRVPKGCALESPTHAVCNTAALAP